MALSLDDIPYEPATLYTDRWLFVLADELNGEHGGTFFELGVATRPLDVRGLRKFICAHRVLGALRVEGEPLELGDCTKLKPPVEPPVEPEEPPEDPPPSEPRTEALQVPDAELELEDRITPVPPPPPLHEPDPTPRVPWSSKLKGKSK